MTVFRLSKSKYSRDLSGRGAEMTGGRWNSRGTPMLYTSQSRALCTTEIAVHIPLGIVPKDYEMISIEIPDSIKIAVLKTSELPEGWNSIPHWNATQLIGDAFIREGKSLVLKVPSVVVPGDFNFLINPLHRNIAKITVISTELFTFDERLFGIRK
jgi:RES domain-containing protein